MPDTTVIAKPDVPAEITAMIQHYADLFRLADWRIYVEMVDRLEAGGDAECRITHDYWLVNILICRSLVTDNAQWLPVAVLHEIIHIALASQDWAVLAIIDLLGGTAPNPKRTALDMWRHGDEMATERLARLLIEILPKP